MIILLLARVELRSNIHWAINLRYISLDSCDWIHLLASLRFAKPPINARPWQNFSNKYEMYGRIRRATSTRAESWVYQRESRGRNCIMPSGRPYPTFGPSGCRRIAWGRLRRYQFNIQLHALYIHTRRCIISDVSRELFSFDNAGIKTGREKRNKASRNQKFKTMVQKIGTDRAFEKCEFA